MELLNTDVFFQLKPQWTGDNGFKKTNTTEVSIFSEKDNEYKTNNLENTTKAKSDINYYIYGENEEHNTEFKLCSNNNQETYNFETDAKETAANLKEIMYNAENDRDEKVLEFFENNLDPANIDLVLQEYKRLTGAEDLQEHLDIVFRGHPFKKNKAKKILDSLLNFENKNSKVRNKYWEGDSHNITRKGSIFTITNKETNQTREINLAVLLKNFNTSEERKNFVETLQKLPGEVLMDIAIEQTTLVEIEGNTEVNTVGDKSVIALAYYSPGTDQIAVQSECTTGTIIHELGHSIDYNKLFGNNVSSVHCGKEFLEIFNKEMEKYLAEGNKKYVYGDESTYSGAVVTVNEMEMFAACYTLLMTGEHGCREAIETYFPTTLRYTGQLLEYFRSLPDSTRH